MAPCGLVSAAFGLDPRHAASQPRFSGLLFAVVLGPMMLFGCAYYPYAALDVLGPVQYVFLLNPLVFMSEAMRLAVTPERAATCRCRCCSAASRVYGAAVPVAGRADLREADDSVARPCAAAAPRPPPP